MHKKRLGTLALTFALSGPAVDAWALGFGATGSNAVLGQPLDHQVGLRVEADEVLPVDCVSAEVAFGDRRLPPAMVSARVEPVDGRSVVRVQTSLAVDEPVVVLTVSIGCTQRLAKQFVLLADPPPAALPSAPIAPPVESLGVPPPAAPARPGAPQAAAEPRPAASAPSAVPPARAGVRAAAPAASAPRLARQTRRPAAEAAQAAAPPRSRLKLDAVDAAELAQARAEAIEAAASAAVAAAQDAALKSAEAASAAATRVAALEKSIDRMRSDAIADREAIKLLRQRAATGESSAAWLPFLAGLTALLAALSAWLAFKLRRLQKERRLEWWSAAAGAEAGGAAATAPKTEAMPTEAAAGAPSTGGPTSVPTTRPGTLGPLFAPAAAAEPPPDDATRPIERTQPLPVGWREEPEPARDVSIEELIDLEQQAEFFTVLGQEEAAIDLLVDHLRSTGGGSPMPYLKLLDIYRRRGDREAYDRTRARFNHRFNAYAPDWDADASEGRSLEDYPSIIARLQMAWPSPIDAMAELESLLFRKSRGDLFDLPAYRDVLFLYSLARDLLDREPLESGNVDVLLPISDGTEFTQPMSLEDTPAAVDSGLVSLDNQPTVPVDLDITQPNLPESLFGETATDPGLGSPRRR